MEKAYAVTESPAYGRDIRSLDPVTQHDALVTTLKNNPYFILFYQQGTDGEQTARSSGDLGNRSDRWWFKQIMSDPQPFITKSYLDVNTKSAVTSVIYPVYSAGSSNHMDGVLVAEMYNYVDGTKTVVSNGQETQENFDLSPVLKSLTAAALSGYSGEQEQSDESAIYAYAPISLPGNSSSWAVVTIQSRDGIGELAASLNTTVERLKSYISYINEITDVLNRFSRGNLKFELTYDYTGEFSKIKDALIAIQIIMNQTLLHIRQASSEVASGSDQVAGFVLLDNAEN